MEGGGDGKREQSWGFTLNAQASRFESLLQRNGTVLGVRGNEKHGTCKATTKGLNSTTLTTQQPNVTQQLNSTSRPRRVPHLPIACILPMPRAFAIFQPNVANITIPRYVTVPSKPLDSCLSLSVIKVAALGVRLAGSAMVTRELQPSNARLPMKVRLAGNLMVVRELQPSNARWPM